MKFSMEERPFSCSYGYILRDPQDQDKISIEFQERKIHQWARLNNSRFMGMFIETGTPDSALFERPIFSQMWSQVDRGDVVIMTDVQGISTTYKDVCILIDELKKKGADAVFVRDGFNTFAEAGTILIHSSVLLKTNKKYYHAEYLQDDDNAP